MPKRSDLSLLTKEEQDAVKARREYQKMWRAANRDRIREHNERYWKKKGSERSDAKS